MIILRSSRFLQVVLYFLILVTLSIVMTTGPVNAVSVPYRSYIYDYWQEPVPTPHAYVPSRVISGRDLGLERLRNPRDIYVTEERIYILDSGNDRLLCLDHDWNLVQVIDSFIKEDQEQTFDGPYGVFVNAQEEIYIADTDNARVVVLDREGELLKIVEAPEPDIEGVIQEGFRFRPRKIGVDQAGRIYIVAADVYDGIMEFDVDGNFRGFIGAPRVAPSVADVVWRQLATEAQRERRALFLPTEYSNLDVDDRGFIYTTVAGGEIEDEEPVRRLNPSGVDVLRRMGFLLPLGDPVGPNQEASRFIDVISREYSIYSVLDSQRGRVFTYDANGNLMYVFGGQGDLKGTFRNPVALAELGDNLLVLDARRARITVFERTEYADLIHGAITHYNHGRYDRATEKWQQVLDRNANYDLAYTGIARSQLRQDDYQEAMLNFRYGNNRQGYSEAFSLYRRDVLADNFGKAVGSILGIIVIIIVLRRLDVRKKVSRFTEAGGYVQAADSAASEAAPPSGLRIELARTLRGLGYAFHVILHPFGGFWDLKHEKIGTVTSGATILVLVTLSYVFMVQYTGFIFNPRDLSKVNVLVEMASVLFPFTLWCLVNWALTTFMEGKGTLRDVFIASSYSLMPVFLIMVPNTIVSNYLTTDEGAFYYVLLGIALVWTMGLLVSSTMVIHDYDLPTTVGTLIFIIIGMGTVLFIGLLFFSLIDLLRGFVGDIYREIVFRM